MRGHECSAEGNIIFLWDLCCNFLKVKILNYVSNEWPHLVLQAEAYTDEVFAQITLIPVSKVGNYLTYFSYPLTILLNVRYFLGGDGED